MFRTTYENNKKELDIVRYGTFEGDEKDIKNAGIEELENIIDSILKFLYTSIFYVFFVALKRTIPNHIQLFLIIFISCSKHFYFLLF